MKYFCAKQWSITLHWSFPLKWLPDAELGGNEAVGARVVGGKLVFLSSRKRDVAEKSFKSLVRDESPAKRQGIRLSSK